MPKYVHFVAVNLCNIHTLTLLFSMIKYTLCLKKNIPDVFSYNSRKH